MVHWLLPQFFCNVHPLKLKERKKKDRSFTCIHTFGALFHVVHACAFLVSKAYVPKVAPACRDCVWASGYKIVSVEMHHF